MIYSAILSCFDSKGLPDTGATAAVTEHNISRSGVDGLFVNGSTGENSNMDTAAKKAILRAVSGAAAGRVKLIGHIGTNLLEEFTELADFCAAEGYDAVAATAPVYFGYTQEEYVRYFHTLADHSPLPLYVYNIPARTHAVFSRKAFREILTHPNIRGTKFTDTDLGLFEQVRRDCPDTDLLSGYDHLLVAYTALGADGTIGTFYNLLAKTARAIFLLTFSGRLGEARKLQAELNEIMEQMCDAGNMISSVKAVMELYGIPCGDPRFPNSPVSARQRAMAGRAWGRIEEVQKAADAFL